MTDKRNASGAVDPTAYEAIKNAEVKQINEQVARARWVIRDYLRSRGMELIGRIPVRHIKSGREYR